MALSDTVAALETNYAALTTAVNVTAAEISKLAGEVSALQTQLANGGVDPALVSRAQAVADGLATQAAALTAATTSGG